MGAAPTSVNMEPPRISEILELESRNFAHISTGPSIFSGWKFFLYGACGGRSAR